MALNGLDRRSGTGGESPRLTWLIQYGLLGSVLVSVGVIAWLSGVVLGEAGRGEVSTATSVYLVLAVVAFCLSCSLVVFSYAYRLVTRLVGPSYRIIDAMKRVRAGDIGFRVHLRKGDLLIEVANEFNRLLDWLNTNPPTGNVKRGTDVVEVGDEEDDEMVGTHSGPELFPEEPEVRG